MRQKLQFAAIAGVTAVTVTLIMFWLQAPRADRKSDAWFVDRDGIVKSLSAQEMSGRPLTLDLFEKIAARMNPTVVNVYTTQRVAQQPLGDLFSDPFFKRFFGDNVPEEERHQSALGSGVIIDSQGYILTNNHVVEKA